MNIQRFKAASEILATIPYAASHVDTENAKINWHGIAWSESEANATKIQKLLVEYAKDLVLFQSSSKEMMKKHIFFIEVGGETKDTIFRAFKHFD